MNSEERKILEETYRLAKENNKALKKIRRHMTYGTIFRLVYWGVIIGAGIGLFYFLQPYLENITSVYSGFTDQINTVNGFFNNGGSGG